MVRCNLIATEGLF